MIKNRYHLACAFLFLLTLILRLVLLQQFSDTSYFNFTLKTVTGPDQNTFYEWGLAIQEGHWDFRRLRPGEPFYIAPLYSVLIALFLKLGITEKGVLILQALLSSGLVFAFFGIGAQMGNRKAGLIAALLWCFYGPSYFYDSCLIRASLITSITFILCWSLMAARRNPDKKREWIRTGILSGVLAALRPHPIFLLLPLWVFIRGDKKDLSKRFKRAALVLGVSLIVISPITIRNYMTSGEWVPIAKQGADAFWLGNSPDTLGVSYFPSRKSAQLLEDSGRTLSKSIPVWFSEMASDPAGYFGLYQRKLKMLMNNYEIAANYSFYVFRRLVPISNFAFLTFIWIIPLAFVGLGYIWPRKTGQSDFIFIMTTMLVSALLIHIQSRYRFPIIPFAILLAGFGVYGIYEWIQCRDYRRITASLAITLLLMFHVRDLPSYGQLTHYDESGNRVLATSRIRDVDYITWITSILLSNHPDKSKRVRELLDEAKSIYGPEFVLKFQNSVDRLRKSS